MPCWIASSVAFTVGSIVETHDGQAPLYFVASARRSIVLVTPPEVYEKMPLRAALVRNVLFSLSVDGCRNCSMLKKKNALSWPSKRPGIMMGPPMRAPGWYSVISGFGKPSRLLNQLFVFSESLRR